MSISIFSNPVKQLDTMKDRIRYELKNDVGEELFAYVEIKSQMRYDIIYNVFLKRIDSINDLYQTESESKQEDLERMQHFLELTNPKYLADELKRVLVFKDIEEEYKSIMNYFSKDSVAGKYFLSYQFDSAAYNTLEAGLLFDIGDLNEALEIYSSAVTKHINFMKSLHDTRGLKTAFRISTKIVGSLLAGPIGSIAGGTLARALTDDQSVISDSYNEVIHSWSEYIHSFDLFLSGLNKRYEHILLTLVGGLFLRVSQDLRGLHIGISHLNLGEYGIQYEVEAKELNRYRVWMRSTIDGIIAKITERNYKATLQGANELYNFINQNNILKYENFTANQCFLYTASLYKFAGIYSYIMTKETKPEEFSEMVADLYSNQPLLFNEDDLIALNVPTQLDLTVRWAKLLLNNKEFGKKAGILADFLVKNNRRYEENGAFLGESLEASQFYNFLIVIGKMLHLDYDKPEFKWFVKETGVSAKSLKKLIIAYKKITGSEKDEIIGFMNSMIFSSRFWTAVRIIKKPIVYVSLTVSLVTFLIWPTVDNWIEKYNSNPDADQTQKNQSHRSLAVKEGTANIRSEANLTSKIVGTTTKGNVFTIITSKSDSDRRIWYKVKLGKGRTGWISSKVVTLIK